MPAPLIDEELLVASYQVAAAISKVAPLQKRPTGRR
jgi:hypothetical protein